MANKLYEETNIQAIADAIREKGQSGTMTVAEMPSKIAAIPSGGGATEPYKEETLDESYNLISVTMHGVPKIREYEFYQCSTLKSIIMSSTLVIIGSGAFQNCLKLELTSLPSGIYQIGGYAFGGCIKLVSITFTGTPIVSSAISGKSFDNCTNLTTINVPWSQGQVSNAPWGATNATINYNYVP